jgi:hypothetical protein
MTQPTIVPSSCFGRVSETAGFFECPASTLAHWLVGALGDDWILEPEVERDTESAIRELDGQRTMVVTYLVVSAGRWSVILTDGPLGTDVGVIPSRAARDLGVRALRAVSTTEGSSSYEMQLFEMFDPRSTDQQRLQRSVYAANDGGTWRFGSFGEPFDFEDIDCYRQRRKRDRLTSAMVLRYLNGLGIRTQLPLRIRSLTINRSSSL